MSRKIDMNITVGHIVDNPNFDTEVAYRIGYWDDDLNDWVSLYNSREDFDDPPAELLVEKITYITIGGDGMLVLEVRR